MMKIAYFTDTFLPQINGVATSLANQARYLGEQDHQILIFTPKLDNIKREKFKAKNVHLIYLPAIPATVYPEFKLGVFGLPKVISHLVKFKPHIIHLHTPLTVGMDAILAAKLFKRPLVGTIHTTYTDSDYLRWLKYKLAVKLVDKAMLHIQNFIFHQCDLVLSPSKILVKNLSNNGFKKPVVYLPNGLMIQKPNFLSDEQKRLIRKKYGLKEKVVLHFGRLSHEKNIDILVKAFHQLTKTHQNISLLIIGDGPATKHLKKLVKKLRMEKETVFTGFVDHQFLISSGLLSIGDVFATASTMENNPMAVLESMVFGLPIVGVKQAGLIELVTSNGLLVKPGDSKQMAAVLDKILFDNTLANQMRKRSLQMIRHYSIDNTVEKLLGLYGQVINS